MFRSVKEQLWLAHDAAVRRLTARTGRMHAWLSKLPLSGDYEHAKWLGEREDLADEYRLAMNPGSPQASLERERAYYAGRVEDAFCDACGGRARCSASVYPAGDVPWNTDVYWFCVNQDDCVERRRAFGADGQIALMDKDMVQASRRDALIRESMPYADMMADAQALADDDDLPF